MAKRIVTLYIEDNAIDLLVMKGDTVEKWTNQPLEAGLVTQGMVNDETKIAGMLSELFNREKIPAKKVIVCLTGLNSVYRILVLPELPVAIMPEAVKHEAERIIPVPLEQVYLSYQALPSATGESRIFLAAFPRNTTDSLMRTLKKANIKSRFMDLAPLALSRVPNEPRAIILDAHSDSLNIMVVSELLPEVIRGLSLPTEATSLEDKATAIGEEFNRTVSFYNSTHLDKPLDNKIPVFICGDLINSSRSYEQAISGFGYTALPLPSPITSPDGFNANTFLTNIGMALRTLPGARQRENASIIRFNAMPEAYLPKAFPVGKILIPTFAVIGVCAIAYAGLQVKSAIANTENMNQQIVATQANIERQTKEIVALTGQLTAVETQIPPLETVTGAIDTKYAELVNERAAAQGDINQAVMAGINQTSITAANHNPDTMTISGKAMSELEILKYALDLRAGGRYTSVVVTSITQDTSGEKMQPFDFTLTLIK